MIRQPSQTLLRQIRLHRMLFWGLSMYIVVFVALYMYFIMSAVVHVVLRQELASAMREVQTEISELDSAYLAAHETITPQRAGELGLTKLRSISYVKTSGSDALSFEH